MTCVPGGGRWHGRGAATSCQQGPLSAPARSRTAHGTPPVKASPAKLQAFSQPISISTLGHALHDCSVLSKDKNLMHRMRQAVKGISKSIAVALQALSLS